MNAEDELIPTRASLLGRLKDWKDEASWKVFFETYWKLIYNAAIKAGLTDAEAQDVVQETVISVSKSMPSFEYDAVGGSFKSWLLKLTAWRIVDQKRRRDVRPAQRRSDSTTRTATVERIADPAESDLEAIWNEEWEKNLMNAAIRCKAVPNFRPLRAQELAGWKGRQHAQGQSGAGVPGQTSHRDND